MIWKRFSAFAFALSLFVLCGVRTTAQTPTVRLPRPSQKASVMQTVGVTDIKITYSRPGVKGRTIWGDPPAGSPAGTATLDDSRTRAKDAPIVPFGRVWRTGANEATMFEVTDAVMINGQPLPAGRYSLHTIPDRTEWTVIFNKDDGQWGSFAYDEKKDALRVKVKPITAGDNQEWLLFDFDPVTETSAQVNIRWEKVQVPFTVEVKDVNRLAIEKARAAIASSKADDWQSRLQAANFAFQNKLNTEEAMQWLDQSISIKENFNTVGLKARVLADQGKTAEAISLGEKAIQLGKAAKANPVAIANMEALLTEWKAKK